MSAISKSIFEVRPLPGGVVKRLTNVERARIGELYIDFLEPLVRYQKGCKYAFVFGFFIFWVLGFLFLIFKADQIDTAILASSVQEQVVIHTLSLLAESLAGGCIAYLLYRQTCHELADERWQGLIRIADTTKDCELLAHIRDTRDTDDRPEYGKLITRLFNRANEI